MKLFANILGKSKPAHAAEDEVPPFAAVASRSGAPLELDLSNLVDPGAPPRAGGSKRTVNIWDLDESESEAEDTAPAPAPAPAPAANRSRRNRTRLIGFDTSEGSGLADPFDSAEALGVVAHAQFPVGWLLLMDGPGRGHSFSLFAGLAQIGRSDENAVQLDFGDSTISRNNHAAIVYDPADRKFMLGHGGKANIVRLNGKPVISNEELSDGDTISIGGTTLKLKALCGPDFDWADTEGAEDDEGHDDVAIA